MTGAFRAEAVRQQRLPVEVIADERQRLLKFKKNLDRGKIPESILLSAVYP